MSEGCARERRRRGGKERTNLPLLGELSVHVRVVKTDCHLSEPVQNQEPVHMQLS